jgi:glucans biosynthesis protein
VQAIGDWGAGHVELVQIPTPDETNDNIVAFWVPDTPARTGTPFEFSYRLLWQKDMEIHPPMAWVTQTRRGHAYRSKADDSIDFMVDFEGPALKRLATGAKTDAIVTVDANGKVLETNAFPNAETGGWRMTIRMRRLDDKKPVELRAYLRSDNQVLTETWSYILPAE